jgi:hypothetical protein
MLLGLTPAPAPHSHSPASVGNFYLGTKFNNARMPLPTLTSLFSWPVSTDCLFWYLLCTVILVGGGREGISRTITASRGCRPSPLPAVALTPGRSGRCACLTAWLLFAVQLRAAQKQ